jgi:U3 small nucleolar RNA-associated protein 13
VYLDVDDLTLRYREQDFLNYLSLNDYRRAIQLALTMEQPGRLLSLFTNIHSRSALAKSEDPLENTSITGNLSVDEVIHTLPGSDLARLLGYVRDWNAKAKTSGVAQGILYAIVKLRSADDVMQAFRDEAGESMIMDGSIEKTSGPGTPLKELVDALIPYTERHLARTERLVQESYVVDYILGEMDDGMFDGELDDDESSMDVDTNIAIQT